MGNDRSALGVWLLLGAFVADLVILGLSFWLVDKVPIPASELTFEAELSWYLTSAAWTVSEIVKLLGLALMATAPVSSRVRGVAWGAFGIRLVLLLLPAVTALGPWVLLVPYAKITQAIGLPRLAVWLVGIFCLLLALLRAGRWWGGRSPAALTALLLCAVIGTTLMSAASAIALLLPPDRSADLWKVLEHDVAKQVRTGLSALQLLMFAAISGWMLRFVRRSTAGGPGPQGLPPPG